MSPRSKDAVLRYQYFSERRVRLLAADAGIALQRRPWLSIKLPTFAGLLPEATIAPVGRDLYRHEVAQRIEKRLSGKTIQDFSDAKPGNARFAKGTGRVEFVRTFGIESQVGVVMHTRSRASDGSVAGICLFGSLDNLAGHLGPAVGEGWSSSAIPYVAEYLTSHGNVRNLDGDDEESIAYEALKIACMKDSDNPWPGTWLTTAAGSEWFAEIYRDVELDPERWDLDRMVEDIGGERIDRVVVGAPLWVRSRTPRVAR